MKIYTKVGDGGDTYLFGGGKVRKDHPRVAAYGDVDELNSLLGWTASRSKNRRLRAALDERQRELFILGADLATPAGTRTPKAAPRITVAHVDRLEKAIDGLSADLPPLTHFILPGGSDAGAALHLARTVCRRAERAIVPLLRRDRSLRTAQIYLNRLSDYLFVLARWINHRTRQRERLWTGGG